jgi:hypothetical protein
MHEGCQNFHSQLIIVTQLVLRIACFVCFSGLLYTLTMPIAPIRIKVVVVTMFERGKDTGDAPGEFQLGVEREHLDQILSLPAGYNRSHKPSRPMVACSLPDA